MSLIPTYGYGTGQGEGLVTTYGYGLGTFLQIVGTAIRIMVLFNQVVRIKIER